MNEEYDVPFITYLDNLNGFLKNDCLSEGGFSTVYSVKVNLNDNLYCIKSFEFDSSDASKRKIFANQANKLFNINYPSLIPHQFFSFVDLDNQYHPSFIYPFFNKKSLNKNITKLNNTHIIIILIGISEGLRYLHQNNIAHGALEPSNILLDDQFRPILTSFGLNKAISKINSIDPQIPNRGTFNYMPPHCIFQQPDDFKNDIYRFGLIVYFLLSKKDPYSECEKIIHIPLKIVSGSLPKMPDIVPNEFANFTYKCWSQFPQDRPSIQDVCKEVAKLKLPNVDIEKVGQYKEYLKKEADDPFGEFKRFPFKELKEPSLAVQQHQYKIRLNEKGRQIREKQEKERKIKQQQKQQEEERRLQQEREEQMKQQQQLEDERMKQQQFEEEQIKKQQFEEQMKKQQQQLEDERMKQQQFEEQMKQQQLEEEHLKQQQFEEEQMKKQQFEEQMKRQQEQEQINKQQIEEEQMKQQQQLKEDDQDKYGDIFIERENDDQIQKNEKENYIVIDNDNDESHLQQENGEDEHVVIIQEQPLNDQNQNLDKQQQQFEEDKKAELLESIFSDDYTTTNDSLQKFMPNLDDNPVPELPDDDFEIDIEIRKRNATPQSQPPIPDAEENSFQPPPDFPLSVPNEVKPRRTSSRIRKARINPFSDSPPSSSSPPSDNDDSDLSFTSRNRKSRRTSSKPSPSKSNMTTRSGTSNNNNGSSNSSRSKGGKSKSSSSRKKGGSNSNNINKKKDDDEYDNVVVDYSSDIDMAMFEMLNNEDTYDDSSKFGGIDGNLNNIDDDYSEDDDDDDESHIKDVLSIQKPKKKKKNQSKTDEEKFFSSLELSNESKKLVKMAQSGDAASQNELGIALIEGKDNFPMNHKMAFKFLDKAVKNNNNEAMINLGRCYEEGIGTASDYKSAFELYQSAYESSNSQDESVKYYAASYLGHCYEEGIGCRIDKHQAVSFYELCYPKGIAIANYARCLLYGTGIEANPQAAFDLICRCNEDQDNNLILLKGICFELGFGINKDIFEAISCYQRAIEKGNRTAYINLASLLISMGVTSKTRQKTPSNFNAISSYNYQINSNSIDYVLFDDSFTDEIVEKLPDPFDLLSQCNAAKAKVLLADCFLRGVVVDVDLRQAIRNFSNASNQNSFEGTLRYNLYSSAPLSQKSINLIKSAAAEGQNDLALVIYGRLLQKGIATDFLFKSNGGPEDEALNLFKIASDDKCPIGMCQYGKTLLMMQRRAKLLSKIDSELFEGVQKSRYVVDAEIEKEAVSLIKKSADLKYKGGLYNYARFILESLNIITIDNANNNVIMIKNRQETATTNPSTQTVIKINYNFINSTENNNDEPESVNGQNDQNSPDLLLLKEAFSLLRMAADLGNNNARVLFGRLMKHGSFLCVDENAALSYFDLARKSGSKAGIYHYSRTVLSKTKEANKETASLLRELKSSIFWEKNPVKSKAINFYGKCLVLETCGLRKDFDTAAVYFKTAANYPFTEDSLFECSSKALTNYGDLLMCGIGGVEKNKNEGYKCYSQALIINENEKFRMNKKSLYSLGSFLLKKGDKKKGVELIMLAAEKGDVHALLKSAKLMVNGIDDFLAENQSEAFKIYSFLADTGNDIGLFNAGKMMIEGRGTDKNEELGRQLIERAVELKNVEAEEFLNNVE